MLFTFLNIPYLICEQFLLDQPCNSCKIRLSSTNHCPGLVYIISSLDLCRNLINHLSSPLFTDSYSAHLPEWSHLSCPSTLSLSDSGNNVSQLFMVAHRAINWPSFLQHAPSHTLFQLCWPSCYLSSIFLPLGCSIFYSSCLTSLPDIHIFHSHFPLVLFKKAFPDFETLPSTISILLLCFIFLYNTYTFV